RPGLGQVHQCFADRTQVSLAAREHVGDPIDGGRGWLVGDEVGDELRRDESRGGGTVAQVPAHRFRLRRAALRIAAAQQRARTRFVQQLLEDEPDRTVRLLWLRLRGAPASARRRRCRPPHAGEGPAGEGPGQLDHVLLRVPAVDAQRVQLEQFAGIVLVQPASRALALRPEPCRGRTRPDGQEVVEVEEHRGMPRRGEDHVLEAAQHVAPDHIALVAARQHHHRELRLPRNAQVVRPERHQPFDERALAAHPLGQRRPLLRAGDARQPPPRLRPLLVRAARAGAPQRHQRVRDLRPRHGHGRELRRASPQLPRQPVPRVAHTAALARPGAQAEPVQCPQPFIHGCCRALVVVRFGVYGESDTRAVARVPLAQWRANGRENRRRRHAWEARAGCARHENALTRLAAGHTLQCQVLGARPETEGEKMWHPFERRRLLVLLGAAAAVVVTLGLLWRSAIERTRSKPDEPFRIAGNLYYVGAAGVTSFLLTGPAGHVLIDGGYPESAPAIMASIAKLGFDIRDVKVLLNTHAHSDHAGGLRALQEASGAELWVSEGDAAVMAAGRNA